MKICFKIILSYLTGKIFLSPNEQNISNNRNLDDQPDTSQVINKEEQPNSNNNAQNNNDALLSQKVCFIHLAEHYIYVDNNKTKKMFSKCKKSI